MMRLIPLVIAVVVFSLSVNFDRLRAQQPVAASEANSETLKVFSLRNANAEDIRSTLSHLYKDGESKVSISADLRTNSIIVTGDRISVEMLEELVKLLDSDVAAPPVLIVPNQDATSIKRELAEELAGITEVELAFDQDLGLMMVRSQSKERVQRFTDTLSQLTAQISGNSQDTDRETLVRVTWLATRQESEADELTVAPDDTLTGAIERLATMGYKDLVVAGQLMTRCAIGATSSSFSPKFEVEGRTPAEFEFAVRGNVMKRAASQGADSYDVQMSIQVNQTVGNKPGGRGSSLSVVVRMNTDAKPIVLGSAPVFGRQSFFVVQFLND